MKLENPHKRRAKNVSADVAPTFLNKRICVLLRQGRNVKQIAEIVGCTGNHVYRVRVWFQKQNKA